jgi:hypothetical protein
VRSKIGLVLVGLALGGTATAAAASTAWQGNGRTYVCDGAAALVECAETVRHRPGYRVSFIPGRLLVSYDDEVIFECARTRQPNLGCRLYEASRRAPGPGPDG